MLCFAARSIPTHKDFHIVLSKARACASAALGGKVGRALARGLAEMNMNAGKPEFGNRVRDVLINIVDIDGQRTAGNRRSHRASVHPCTTSPPSTMRVWPVMYEASSLARKVIAAATSRGSPGRPTRGPRTDAGRNLRNVQLRVREPRVNRPRKHCS